MSEYLDQLRDTTASNYSIQPGKPMDVKDHSVNTVPTATQDHQGTVKPPEVSK